MNPWCDPNFMSNSTCTNFFKKTRAPWSGKIWFKSDFIVIAMVSIQFKESQDSRKLFMSKKLSSLSRFVNKLWRMTTKYDVRSLLQFINNA